MSSALRLAAMMALGAVRLPAQTLTDRSLAELEQMYARVLAFDSATAVRQRDDSVRAAGDPGLLQRSRAKIITSGRITLVIMEALPSRPAEREAHLADSVLASFDVVPAALAEGAVYVMPQTTGVDSALAAAGLAGRNRLTLDWQPGDTSNFGGWRVLDRLTQAWIRWTEFESGAPERRRPFRLDSMWARWAYPKGGLEWSENDAENAVEALTAPASDHGRECLAGVLARCVTYLGLDSTSRPYLTRWTASDRRSMVERYPYYGVRDESRRCIDGDDDLCLRLLERRRWDYPVPAPEVVRASLLRSVAALHGAASVRQTLADSTGALGERLSRATGIPLDSMVAEWRLWTLGRGRTDRVRAGIPDVFAALLTGSVLILLAARTGRWR